MPSSHSLLKPNTTQHTYMRTNSIKAENKQAKPAIQSSQLAIKIKKKTF